MDVINNALNEDLCYGPDVTTEAIFGLEKAEVQFVARAHGVLAGSRIAEEVFRTYATQLKMRIDTEVLIKDGEVVAPGDVILRISGPLRVLLTAERVALNIVSHLSGIATHTSKWVKQVAGTETRIRDTRKTLPGLRQLQKYAVVCGGGINHRMGLGDAALIKDNHIAYRGIKDCVSIIRKAHPHISIEVECDTLTQVAEALDSGVRLILLDNMSVDQVKIAVDMCRKAPHPVEIEASGGLTLDVALSYAQTGVDYLAVGELTHSVRALDIGCDVN